MSTLRFSVVTKTILLTFCLVLVLQKKRKRKYAQSLVERAMAYEHCTPLYANILLCFWFIREK